MGRTRATLTNYKLILFDKEIEDLIGGLIDLDKELFWGNDERFYIDHDTAIWALKVKKQIIEILN